RTDGSDEDEGLGCSHSVMTFLPTMARETKSGVRARHHVNGPYNNADKPIPPNGVRDHLSDAPEVVITLHRGGGDDEFSTGPSVVRASVVKNRGGKADASGETYAESEFQGDRMMVADLEAACTTGRSCQ